MAVYRIIPRGDLEIRNRRLVLASGLAYLRQKISARFKFFLGEWFLDLREGIPYYRDVLVKNPDLDIIRSLFRRVLVETPGVLSVPRFAVVLDRQSRELAFRFQAVCEGGTIIVEPSDRAFILTVPEAA